MLTDSQRETAERNLPLVRLVAGVMSKRLPGFVPIDDLIGAGQIGLIAGVMRLDSANAGGKAYLKQRIEGAILDYLRSIDSVSRLERKRRKVGDFWDHPNRFNVLVAPENTLRGIIDRQRMDVVIRAMSQLRPRVRSILLRIHFDGLTVPEVAAELGVTSSRVWQLHGAGIELLRIICKVT